MRSLFPSQALDKLSPAKDDVAQKTVENKMEYVALFILKSPLHVYIGVVD